MVNKFHKKINQIIHQPVRLQIMTFLHFSKTAKFSELKKELGVSDGNLGSHLQKLEDAKLIAIKKKFIENKPSSVISITSKGEAQLIDYLDLLKELII